MMPTGCAEAVKIPAPSKVTLNDPLSASGVNEFVVACIEETGFTAVCSGTRKIGSVELFDGFKIR